ncbi:hypothetical protein IDJ77_26055 [Mucilaginibacter sp. ZT4R22]|uniref:Cytochrome oxidase complex assembly protein 1 n=1 Tax=Mucilaginibacter pankratovii TaxID=2772110 RepID=A0ABR7WYD5_9SPHI|nr:hypothetical protein [Mucilaginibacter pankratovii]MBD1367303.1 hypothetical protein [Mucilaginibacter pankratovii]
MEKDYLKAKQIKKESAKTAVWLLVAFGIVFVFILVKIANSNSMSVFNGLPDSDAAYAMAKLYIRPAVRSTNVTFHDDSYKFAKKSDSVYVIKSSYSARESDGQSTTTYFTISMRYMGGSAKKEESWKLLDLNQE